MEICGCGIDYYKLNDINSAQNYEAELIGSALINPGYHWVGYLAHNCRELSVRIIDRMRQWRINIFKETFRK